MKKTIFTVYILMSLAGMASAEVAPLKGEPKYVFLFIGDGMGMAQIHSAEAYLGTLQAGKTDVGSDKKDVRLIMNGELTQIGIQTTYDYGALITDSASAGTALACGHKTYTGVISMDPAKKVPYKTIAEAAKEKGMKVGILTSVSLDHATPAVFYSHVDTRSKYFHIAQQAANSGTLDFIGGGSFLYTDGYTGTNATKWPELAKGAPGVVNLWKQFQNQGFKVVHALADLKAVPAGAKCVAASADTQDSSAMHYQIDKPETEWNLAEVTAEAIRILDNADGFFMMVEGGKIDWTCHANDARTSIDDVIAMDNAVAEAVKFAEGHPGQVLIIVTADHETGGLTQGWAGTQYASAYETLKGQTMSFTEFSLWLAEYQADPESLWNWMAVWVSVFGPEDADMSELDLADDKALVAKIKEAFGLDYAALTNAQKAELEEAYDCQMSGEVVRDAEEDYLLFGGYQPLAITCTHLTNARAGLGWTTYQHTAVPVPVMSNDSHFAGYYDNTDMAKKLAAIMGVSLD
jgi:alkaline phosphatase